MPISSQEQYDKAKTLIDTGKAKDPARLQKSMQRWERFAMPQTQTLVEGIGPGSSFEKLQNESALQADAELEPLKASTDMVRDSIQKDAKSAAPALDLTQPDIVQRLVTDPAQKERLDKARALLRDPSLPNASGLKMFNDPPDYVPPKPKLSLANPLASLPTPLQRHYFYEPSVEEFRSAMNDGSVARRMRKEFGGTSDLSTLPDEYIQSSDTFKAYQDASWKHALAEAMKEGFAISRVAHSKEMGDFDKAQAKALDYVPTAATGLMAGMTGGLSRPTDTQEETRASARNPKTALASEVIGTLSPTGLPSRMATGAAKLLGKAGLASTGLSGVTKGIAASAMTGAADAGLRDVAKFTADALDAADTAEEAAHRFYEMAQGLPANMARGAGYGAAFGAGGEAIGSLAKAGARGVVGGQPRDILLHGQSSGVKMGGLGEPVLPKELEVMAGEAAAKRATAEGLIADDVAPKLLSQRLSEQESAAARAADETAVARARLGSATVDTRTMADEIIEFANEMPGITPQARAKRTALQRYGRKIRGRQNMTAKELDDVISEVDSQANQDLKRPDADWNKAGAILRKARDEFKFNEPTLVENHAIRGKEGEVKGVSDYSGIKARQSREQDMQEFDNRQMGLPAKLDAAPVSLPNAPGGDELAALAEGSAPQARIRAEDYEGFKGRILGTADPKNFITSEKILSLARRSGLDNEKAIRDIQRLRDAQNWKQYLGRAISGIGSGGGTYVKMNNVLRAVPTLNSLSGGMPKMEATQEAVDVVDRFLQQAVPSWKGLHLRGGQGARPAGALADDSRGKPRDNLTDEEADFAAKVLRSLKLLEQQ